MIGKETHKKRAEGIATLMCVSRFHNEAREGLTRGKEDRPKINQRAPITF